MVTIHIFYTINVRQSEQENTKSTPYNLAEQCHLLRCTDSLFIILHIYHNILIIIIFVREKINLTSSRWPPVVLLLLLIFQTCEFLKKNDNCKSIQIHGFYKQQQHKKYQQRHKRYKTPAELLRFKIRSDPNLIVIYH